jgi:hypothetical protein
LTVLVPMHKIMISLGGTVDASTVSACIAAISATVSAFSAWNSRRSAQASQIAVREAREQRQVDNARAMLAMLGSVYDDSMGLIESLARDLIRDPASVAQHRSALQRSALVAGVTAPSLQRLMEASVPLTPEEVATVRDDLMAISASLHARAGADGAFSRLDTGAAGASNNAAVR